MDYHFCNHTCTCDATCSTLELLGLSLLDGLLLVDLHDNSLVAKLVLGIRCVLLSGGIATIGFGLVGFLDDGAEIRSALGGDCLVVPLRCVQHNEFVPISSELIEVGREISKP